MHASAIFTGYLQFDGRKEDESDSDSELDEFHDALQSLKSKTTSPSAFDVSLRLKDQKMVLQTLN